MGAVDTCILKKTINPPNFLYVGIKNKAVEVVMISVKHSKTDFFP